MDFTAVLSVLAVYSVAVMSPGPNFVAVCHRALSGSRRETFGLIAGIVTVNLVWASAALIGASTVFKLYPYLFGVIRTLGAAYIIWFGIQLVRQARVPLPDVTPGQTGERVARAYREGFTTNIGNPKAVVFYGSVFSTLVPSHLQWPTAVAMLGVIALLGVLWYGSVALVLSASHGMRFYRRSKMLIESICGGVLILFGIRQALVR